MRLTFMEGLLRYTFAASDYEEEPMDHIGAEARPSILIVEPDPGSRAALQTVLRPFADLHTAGSAAEALQMLAAHRDIHLATVEVRLPDVSGIDLLHEVRREHPEVD